jgi:MFS family permease
MIVKNSASPFAPLKIPLFRALWIANTAANIGTWVQDVGGTWYMTSLTTSSTFVALMQVATSLPLFFLALPSGVAADLFDRRKVLLFTLAWSIVSAFSLGFLVLSGLKSPALLFLLTFLMNLGGTLFIPAWQASIPEIVPADQVSGAVSLNSASFNVARAIGPAVGGFLLAATGAWATYLLNGLLTVVLIILVFRWKRNEDDQTLPPEQFLAALRTGIRYVRHSAPVKSILVRTAFFIVPASALFALLPTIVRQELKQEASSFGLLLGFVGLGAIVGVTYLPKLRKKLSIDLFVVISSLILAISIHGLGTVKNMFALCLLMFLAGVGWLISLSSFNVSLMSSVPNWVRGRATAVYLLIFYGGMSAGAALWGFLGDELNPSYSLSIAALFLAVGNLSAKFYKLPESDSEDLSPSGHWAEPVTVRQVNPYNQAAVVTVEYKINPLEANAFKKSISRLKELKQRDGAFSWELIEDVSEQGRYLEVFYLESWAEHLHQHSRVVAGDKIIEDEVRQFHKSDDPPKVTHFLVAKLK